MLPLRENSTTTRCVLSHPMQSSITTLVLTPHIMRLVCFRRHSKDGSETCRWATAWTAPAKFWVNASRTRSCDMAIGTRRESWWAATYKAIMARSNTTPPTASRRVAAIGCWRQTLSRSECLPHVASHLPSPCHVSPLTRVLATCHLLLALLATCRLPPSQLSPLTRTLRSPFSILYRPCRTYTRHRSLGERRPAR